MTPQESHAHSLITLNYINRLDDYMSNLKNICDMGAGFGKDAMWFAKCESEAGVPRNFNVTAVEIAPQGGAMPSARNMQWIFEDFSTVKLPNQDLIWCHDALQYSINPIGTLWHWHNLLNLDGLLLIEIPYKLSINDHVEHLKPDYTFESGCYHIYTLGNLILQLASAGFDCRNAHFQLDRENGWIRAGVYKTDAQPKFYNSWYDLKDTNRLPYCLDDVINKQNRFNDTDITVEWIDRSISILSA